MKTSVKPILHFRVDAEGRRTLIFQIIHERRRSVVFTPYRLLPEEFSPKKGAAVYTSRSPKHRAYIREVNDCIDVSREELLRVVARLQQGGQPYTAQEITSSYKCGGNNHYVRTFTLGLIADLEAAKSFGTARSYRSLLSAFEKFHGDARCRFAQIDTRMVLRFEEYLKKKDHQQNTVSFYLRTLRALYNRARKQDYAPSGNNPFADVSFRTARTPKLAVSRTLLKLLAKTDFNTPELNEARDLFLLSFYARGMSFVDIAYLRHDKIWDGALHYFRRKTHQMFSVYITPQIGALIERYQGNAPWVFPAMNRGRAAYEHKHGVLENTDNPARHYRYYLLSLQYYLGLLERISERLGCRKLTFNVARHTWATQARGMGFAMPFISEGLGHTSEKTTRTYLAGLDTREVDRLNEKVTRL